MPIIFTFYVEATPIVEPLSDDMLIMTFSDEVVVDDVYLDPATYGIEIIDGAGEAVEVREVQAPQDGLTTYDVILVLDKPTHGTHYRVSTVTDLNGRDGDPVGGSSDFIARRTKTENMLRALPQHFNTRPDSIIRAFVTAIGIQDDIIGGSRNDTFE